LLVDVLEPGGHEGAGLIDRERCGGIEQPGFVAVEGLSGAVVDPREDRPHLRGAERVERLGSEGMGPQQPAVLDHHGGLGPGAVGACCDPRRRAGRTVRGVHLTSVERGDGRQLRGFGLGAALRALEHQLGQLAVGQRIEVDRLERTHVRTVLGDRPLSKWFEPILP
jgi:hypothetical protein